MQLLILLSPTDNTVETHVFNNNFFSLNNHHVNNVSIATSPLFSSNFEILINVNNNTVFIQFELKERAINVK